MTSETDSVSTAATAPSGEHEDCGGRGEPGKTAVHAAEDNGRSSTDQPGRRRTNVDDEMYTSGFFARLMQRLEAAISRLSTRNNFWHRVCSWVWLPLAYRSGIKFSRGDESSFSAILPFRKFNKNWYNAMAGGALLGNAEVAGGMYVFKKCGADYTVVCKHLEYTFRRPCHGPAVYRVEPREDIGQLVDEKGEFNITVDMDIVQMVRKPGDKERRCGHCTATFHVTPKTEVRRRARRRSARQRG